MCDNAVSDQRRALHNSAGVMLVSVSVPGI